MTPKSVALALVTVSLPLVLGSVTGCAADESEERAAFPQPIGYTVPPSDPASAQAGAPLGQPAEYAPNAPAASMQGAVDPNGMPVAPPQQDPSAPEVVVGADDDGQQAAEPEYGDTDPSALTDFHAALDPYGTWTEDATYGTVWVPSASAVGGDFTPYVSAGHWVYDDDYTWVSDYGWGWAPFHYGRWVWAQGLGWEWIPGRRYAGAWVSWRYGLGDWGYVGWAPLGPTWCWRHGRAVGIGFVPRMPYAFVGRGELFSPHVGARLVTGPQASIVATHTQPYAPGSRIVGGRVVARPTVGGPPPAMLNLPSTAVAHGSFADRGAILARAYARPSTAVAQGAHPRSVPEVSSHFGGRLGGGFAGTAVVNAPGYGRAVSPQVSRPYFGATPVGPSYHVPTGAVSQVPRFSSAPTYRAPAASFRSPSVGAAAAPSSAGVSRPSGGYSGGGVSRPSGGYSGGFSPGGSGFHGGGGGSSFHGSSGGSRGGGGRR